MPFGLVGPIGSRKRTTLATVPAHVQDSKFQGNMVEYYRHLIHHPEVLIL
jgi:hypothetical protein